ncbi:MAG: hypothetical protein CSYNP_01642 [Syntrophus sp. SKADARSKE-3]|nr:hypothetical protein [Syntrophus sp. SKADARSKE-3]
MTDFSKSHENLHRQVFRKTVYRIWNMIQAGLLDELDEAEYRIAKILLEHPEYEDIFDDEDILDGREFDTGSGGNPFLHISIHKMAEDQIESSRPEEVLSFLEAMKEKGNERHEIIHAIMKILVRLISDAMRNQKSFNVDRYRNVLSRYKNINLDDVPEALDREFMGH